VVLGWSFLLTSIASWKYYKLQKSNHYTPLLNKRTNILPTATYGATAATSDNASDDTIIEEIEIKSARWTVFNISRFLFSMVQFGLYLYFIEKIFQHKYEFSVNEGTRFDLLTSYGTHLIFWVSLLVKCSVCSVY
jgi:hypothetical protein